MDKSIINFLLDKRLYFTLFVIISSIVVYNIVKKIIDRKIDEIAKRNAKTIKKRKTYLKLFLSIVKYIIILIDIVILLQIYGVNVSSILAGVGVISLVTGLALQDALKDIIAGANIIIDGYFSIGDVIRIDNVDGKILEIKLKVTKLKDVNNENVFVVANRNIVKALRLSNQLDIDVPIPYEEDINKVEKILHEAEEEIIEWKNVQNVKYVGINQFADSAIYYKLRLWTLPEFKPQIKRDTLRLIKVKLDENRISIPYPQLDVHKK